MWPAGHASNSHSQVALLTYPSPASQAPTARVVCGWLAGLVSARVVLLLCHYQCVCVCAMQVNHTHAQSLSSHFMHTLRMLMPTATHPRTHPNRTA